MTSSYNLRLGCGYTNKNNKNAEQRVHNRFGGMRAENGGGMREFQ